MPVLDEKRRRMLERLERNVLEWASAGREVVDVGPFRALLNPSTDLFYLNYAVPVAPLGPWPAIQEALGYLAMVYAERRRRLCFEFTEELWPELGPALERAGLACERRDPTMTVDAAGFTPVEAPGVAVRLLSAGSRDAEILDFLRARDRSFGMEGAAGAGGEMRELRDRMRAGSLRAAVAHVDLAGAVGGAGGDLAGVACTTPVAGVAELAAVGTLPGFRRRGVAAAASSVLIRDHFERGGDLVWLSAGDAAAEALYRKLGFAAVATHLTYLAPLG